MDFPGVSDGKASVYNAGDPGSIPGLGRSPGCTATLSSVLAWKIPWTEEPGRLHTVHGVAKSQTRLSNFTSHIIQNCISLYFLCFLISAFKIYHSMIKSGINRCCLSISLSPWRNNTLYSTALQNLVQTSIILSFKL